MKTTKKKANKEWTPNGKELEIIPMPRLKGKKGSNIIRPTRSVSDLQDEIIKVARNRTYTASIKILGKTYTSSGKGVRDAIEALKLGGVAKGVSVLEIVHGKNRKSVILPAPMTFRVFSSSGMVREISMKNLSLRFSGI